VLLSTVLRFYQPTQIWHYGYLQRFYARKWHLINLEKLVFPGAKVLDYGCGDSPYRELINSRQGNYLGIDIKETKFGSLFDGIRAPFNDESFDVVILAEILPVAPDSKSLIKDCQRLLKLNGNLLVSTSFIYPMNGAKTVFEDGFKFDFYRYTEAGLRLLLKDDFKDVATQQLGGLGSHLLFPQYFYRNFLMKNKSALVRIFSFTFAPVFLILCVLLNILGRAINRFDPSKLFPSDSVAVAKK
jgi:SAM-dependent methyltransferase